MTTPDWPKEGEVEQLSAVALAKIYDVVYHLLASELMALIERLDGTPDDLVLDYANQTALIRWPDLESTSKDEGNSSG